MPKLVGMQRILFPRIKQVCVRVCAYVLLLCMCVCAV